MRRILLASARADSADCPMCNDPLPAQRGGDHGLTMDAIWRQRRPGQGRDCARSFAPGPPLLRDQRRSDVRSPLIGQAVAALRAYGLEVAVPSYISASPMCMRSPQGWQHWRPIPFRPAGSMCTGICITHRPRTRRISTLSVEHGWTMRRCCFRAYDPGAGGRAGARRVSGLPDGAPRFRTERWSGSRPWRPVASN